MSDASHLSRLDGGLEPYALSVKQVSLSESCCIAEVYNRIGRGEYEAVKDRRRLLILYASVKARRAKLQPAKIKAPRVAEAAASA